MTVSIREAVLDDRRVIVSAWVSSFRDSPYAGLIRDVSWHKVMRTEVAAILDNKHTETLVACDAANEADLFGFVAFDPAEHNNPLVLYTYVKHAFRKMGIARALMKAANVDTSQPFRYACRTNAAADLYHARKIPCAKWDPLSARRR